MRRIFEPILAGATLRVLEGLKHVKMTVVYLVPDLEFATSDEKMRNKVHFGVLQEYTRSGMINEMLIISNNEVLNMAGSGTVYDYFNKANEK